MTEQRPKLVTDPNAQAIIDRVRAEREKQERYEKFGKQVGAWLLFSSLIELQVLGGLVIVTLIRRRCR